MNHNNNDANTTGSCQAEDLPARGPTPRTREPLVSPADSGRSLRGCRGGSNLGARWPPREPAGPAGCLGPSHCALLLPPPIGLNGLLLVGLFLSPSLHGPPLRAPGEGRPLPVSARPWAQAWPLRRTASVQTPACLNVKDPKAPVASLSRKLPLLRVLFRFLV